MGKEKIMNWCMFGQRRDGLADKGVTVGYNKIFGAWTCSIFRLKEPVPTGKRWGRSNVKSEIFHLCFCSPEALDGFIKQLMMLRAQMTIQGHREEDYVENGD